MTMTSFMIGHGVSCKTCVTYSSCSEVKASEFPQHFTTRRGSISKHMLEVQLGDPDASYETSCVFEHTTLQIIEGYPRLKNSLDLKQNVFYLHKVPSES